MKHNDHRLMKDYGIREYGEYGTLPAMYSCKMKIFLPMGIKSMSYIISSSLTFARPNRETSWFRTFLFLVVGAGFKFYFF